MTTYLSTLCFDDGWLDALRSRVPHVQVQQVPAEKAGDISDEHWAQVDVLHTSSVLPDPAIAPRLRWVQLDTSGVDHVVDSAVWRSDIEITTIGGVSPVPLAEYVLFAILGHAHRLPELLQVRADREWPSAKHRWQRFMPRPVAGSTLCVVGYGRIGREIGRLARAHGMHVIGVTRSGEAHEQPHQVDFAPRGDDTSTTIVGTDRLHEVLAVSDHVVVVVPLTPETRGLVDMAAVAAMRPGAVLVDVSRGGIVDEAAVLDALHAGRLGGAVFDVFDDEPLPSHSPWWTAPNTLVTPHVAGLAPRYAEQVLEIVATNLQRFTDGADLLNRVDRVRGY